MIDKTLKVGIIGPRTFVLSGYELDNEVRVDLRNLFCRTLSFLSSEYKVLLGITGLGLGVEQDFAIACKELDIDYQCYEPFPDQELRWPNTEQSHIYQELKDNALNFQTLSKGKYSPKKNLAKNLKVAKDADVIFYVTHMYNFNDKLLDSIKQLPDKKVVYFNIGKDNVSLIL